MSILCCGALEVSLIHSLLWHLVSFFSVALTKLVQKLDKKSPSKLCLPTNYPSWAVDSSCVVTPSRSSDVLPRRLNSPGSSSSSDSWTF